MRTTLIMFALLLVVLTLLSSFGGAIRAREPFFEEVEQTIDVTIPATDVAADVPTDVPEEEQVEMPIVPPTIVPQLFPPSLGLENTTDPLVDDVYTDGPGLGNDIPLPFASDDVMTEQFATV